MKDICAGRGQSRPSAAAEPRRRQGLLKLVGSATDLIRIQTLDRSSTISKPEPQFNNLKTRTRPQGTTGPGSNFCPGLGEGAGKPGTGPTFPKLNVIYSPGREKPKPTTAALPRGATAMQAGLTPLTFTVGPGLLAQRRPQVRDPKPGIKGHHRGWARAPHAEPAAPNASPPASANSHAAIAPGCYRTQSSGATVCGGGEICPELLGQMTQPHREFPLASTKGPEGGGAKSPRPFQALPHGRVRTIAHAVPFR